MSKALMLTKYGKSIILIELKTCKLQEIAVELSDFFKQHNKLALAFSGGADSAYLMYAAKKYGAEIKAYYVKTPFQPRFELEDAAALAQELNVPMEIIECDVLAEENIAKNGEKRCYYCKNRIFSLIKQAAAEDGFSELMDGSNASDSAQDRPGMKALSEMAVLSPLRECGIEKAQLRQLSKDAGLFTWNKPAYACLATRITAGTEIKAEMLEKVEKGEDFLRKLGFSDLRLRVIQGAFKLQLPSEQLAAAVEKREDILRFFDELGENILLDLKSRKSE